MLIENEHKHCYHCKLGKVNYRCSGTVMVVSKLRIG